jgi:hypothetical protein
VGRAEKFSKISAWRRRFSHSSSLKGTDSSASGDNGFNGFGLLPEPRLWRIRKEMGARAR